MQELFFDLIRVALGTLTSLSRLPSEDEWDEMFVLAKKQSLVGITFIGLQKLGADPSTSSGQVQDEWYTRIGMSEDLYFTWVGVAAKINVQNELVNQPGGSRDRCLNHLRGGMCLFPDANYYKTDE